MDQAIKYFELRIDLLQAHLNEQQSSIAAEKAARDLLKSKHQKERNSLTFSEKANRLEWASLVVRQAEEIN